MMISEIHKEDLYYENRDRLIGRTIKDMRLSPSDIPGYERGWITLDTEEHFFRAVKVSPDVHDKMSLEELVLKCLEVK